MKTARLKNDLRCQSILDAVRNVFAERGFHGTTTRELAKAAGISEALLFRHFPTKERLYAAVREDCIKGPILDEYNRVMALEASASTMVILVHFLANAVSQGCDPKKRVLNRLVMQSLLDDGEFARAVTGKYLRAVTLKLEQCLRVAARNGDVQDIPVRSELRPIFAHHLFIALQVFSLPKKGVLDYKVSHDALIEQAVWFCLLGFGLKPATIARLYNPKALQLMAV
jgi:AcrR family transcriptional regulator